MLRNGHSILIDNYEAALYIVCNCDGSVGSA